ncbi:hypothetical protein [Paenibacillus pabuli]|uniref:hypothetical protein n=1 Tax=Paenibacillus pabuli TaxID=1472 RepID=UPI0012FC66ED|nr:hypothetical protein [Paenibacillus pabuli]
MDSRLTSPDVYSLFHPYGSSMHMLYLVHPSAVVQQKSGIAVADAQIGAYDAGDERQRKELAA